MGRIWGFLWNPSENFDAVKEETLSDAYLHYFTLLVIFSVLFALIIGVMLANPAVQNIAGMSLDVELLMIITLMSASGIILGGAIGVLIAGIWMHIWAYAFGGRKGLTQTTKALMYAATPLFVLGWIPVIGTAIGGIWAILLVLTGLMQLQEMYSGRAILALVAALVVPVIIMGAIAAPFILTML